MATGAFILRKERLDEAIKEYGYRSRAEFCRVSGVSRSSLDEMRRGVHEPSLKNIRRILDAFDGAIGFGGLFQANPEFATFVPEKIAA